MEATSLTTEAVNLYALNLILFLQCNLNFTNPYGQVLSVTKKITHEREKESAFTNVKLKFSSEMTLIQLFFFRQTYPQQLLI